MSAHADRGQVAQRAQSQRKRIAELERENAELRQQRDDAEDMLCLAGSAIQGDDISGARTYIGKGMERTLRAAREGE